MSDLAHHGKEVVDEVGPEKRDPTPLTGPSNGFTTLSVAVIGLAVAVFLFRYNTSGYSIWYKDSVFPNRSWDEYLLVNVTWLLLPPLVVILGFLKQNVDEYGMRPPQSGAWKLAGVFFLFMLPILYFMSRRPDFYLQYPLFPPAGRSYTALAIHELTYGFYLLCWEFFFRGFLTFGLTRALGGATAVILQSIAFGVMHYGKPWPEFYSSFFGGLVLGWMALRYRSFFPGFILHWGISAAMDGLAIHAKSHGLF